MSEEIQSILPLAVEPSPKVKPKRAVAKKAARKKAAAKPDEPVVPAAQSEAPAEPEAAATPKRRARKIKAEAATEIETATPPPAAETPAEPAVHAHEQNGDTPVAKKPRRTPIRRKKAAETADAAPEAAAAIEITTPPPPPLNPAPPAPVSEPPALAAKAAPVVTESSSPDQAAASEEGGEESNRSRRWKERRNRFKKWKEKRKASQGGESGDSPDNAGGAEAGEPEPPAPLGPPEPTDGILELTPKGYGFLRQKSRSYAPIPQDPFVSPEIIRQYGLREGMMVKGKACKAQRGPQVTEIDEVNDRAPEAMRDLPLFEELKAVNPCKRIQLETDKNRLTTRVIDMVTPVGRGQRGLIVAPPRTGKTTLLQHIAEAVVANHPGMHLILLLVDERPEEVTEFKRVLPNAEIFASSNDQDIKSHTRIAQFAIERAKRLVECGEHVFILMDSITRLARAFNNAKQGGATMSGGMGVGAMEIPRRLFAAARNTREAGSLTILATALIETGSRMDDLIFQEFKGTGNMELVLDRKIAEQFYYPAVNIFKSGTRREELLLQSFQLDKIHMLRRGLAGHKPIEALQRVLSLLERYPSNAQMLVDLPSKS